MQKIISSTKFHKQALMYNYRVTQKNARQIISIVYQFGWRSQQLVTYLFNHIGKYFRQRLHVYIKQTFQSHQILSEQQLINFKLEQIFEYLTNYECLQKGIALNLFTEILFNSDFKINLEDYIKLPEERQKLKNNLNERIDEMGMNRQKINTYFQIFKSQWIEKKKKIKIILKPKSQIFPISPQTQNTSIIYPHQMEEKNNQSQKISSVKLKTIHQQSSCKNYSNFFIYDLREMKQSAVNFPVWDKQEEIDIRNPAITYMPQKVKVYSDQSQSSSEKIWKKIEIIDLKTEYYYKRGFIITGFQNSGKSISSFLMSGSSLGIKGTQLLQISNGQNLREKKQFQIQLNENTSVPVYQCTQFQNNCFQFQRILTTNYERYRTLSKMEEIKFIITIRQEGLILRKEFLKAINLFLKNFKFQEMQLTFFESISILITNSTMQPYIIQSQIKQLSKMSSYSEFGLNETEKLLIDNLLKIAIQNNRIFAFPKIDLTQRVVGINPEFNLMLEINNRSKYWVNNDPAKHLHCKTLQDIIKLGPKENIFKNNIEKFLKDTNSQFKKNMQLIYFFKEIAKDIQVKSSSSNSKFLNKIREKRQYYNFDKSIQHQRKQTINELVNHNIHMPSTLPFWIRCLKLLKIMEQIIISYQDFAYYQTQLIAENAEKKIMQLVTMFSIIFQSENQLYKKLVYIIHRLFQEGKIFYKLTRAIDKKQIPSHFNFHMDIKETIDCILTQRYNQKEEKLLQQYQVQQSISLEQCQSVKSLFEQALTELQRKNSQSANIVKYQESIQKLQSIQLKKKVNNIN